MSEDLHIEIDQLKLHILDLEHENKILNDELHKMEVALLKNKIFQKKLLQIHEIFKNVITGKMKT